MPVSVTKTAGNAAEITWNPREDDPRGYLARACESDQLAYALETLGATDIGHRGPVTPEDEDDALRAAMHTTALARELELRSALLVVELRDQYGLSWRRIAVALFEDTERQSGVRRMYESGRRHLGY